LDEKERGVNQLHIIGDVCDCCLNAGLQRFVVTEEEAFFDTTPNSYNRVGIPWHQAFNIELLDN